MNISQKQLILNSIELILSFDFDSFVIENNVSGNIDDLKFGEYSVVDFKNTYLKVFHQLKEELNNGLNLMLPNHDVFNNEFSQVVLDSESSNFYTHLQNFASKDSAAEILKRFVYYQIRQGFWNKSTVKQHNIEGEKLKGAQEELLTVQKALSKNLQAFEKLRRDMTFQIDVFAAILGDKNKESVEITALLERAKAAEINIATLLSSAMTKEAEITSSASNVKLKLDTVTENIEIYKESFSKIETDSKGLSEDLKSNLVNALVNLKASQEGNEFIQNQKGEITRLIGMAADGSLGYKFNKRKEDLERGVNGFWRWAVPGSIVVALLWVIIVFTVLSANLGNEWINLLVNLIKTSPAWLLVGFVFSHYGKERDLQEEYAFKSAIAMTLTAYSQMLSSDDGIEKQMKSSQQEMLLKSIENLYKQPVLKIAKRDTGDSINSKQVVESLHSIANMVKKIKAN